MYKFTIEYLYTRNDVTRRKAVVYANTTDEAIKKIEQVDDFIMIKDLEFEEVVKELKTDKAEAYKEFADRLKEMYGYYDWENKTTIYPEDDIDNLLKELVGDDNG